MMTLSDSKLIKYILVLIAIGKSKMWAVVAFLAITAGVSVIIKKKLFSYLLFSNSI